MAVSMVANGTHCQVQLQPGDTVSFSSSSSQETPLASTNWLISFLKLVLGWVHGKINKYPYIRDTVVAKNKNSCSASSNLHACSRWIRVRKSPRWLVVDTGVEKDNTLLASNGDVLFLPQTLPYCWSFQCPRYLRRWKCTAKWCGSLKTAETYWRWKVVLAAATVDLSSDDYFLGPDILSRVSSTCGELATLILSGFNASFSMLFVRALKTKMPASNQSMVHRKRYSTISLRGTYGTELQSSSGWFSRQMKDNKNSLKSYDFTENFLFNDTLVTSFAGKVSPALENHLIFS